MLGDRCRKLNAGRKTNLSRHGRSAREGDGRSAREKSPRSLEKSAISTKKKVGENVSACISNMLPKGVVQRSPKEEEFFCEIACAAGRGRECLDDLHLRKAGARLSCPENKKRYEADNNVLNPFRKGERRCQTFIARKKKTRPRWLPRKKKRKGRPRYMKDVRRRSCRPKTMHPPPAAKELWGPINSGDKREKARGQQLHRSKLNRDSLVLLEK